MTMDTLWSDRKPCEFLVQSGAHAFKIIQTSKGRRKLMAYFANWETTLKALDTPPVSSPMALGFRGACPGLLLIFIQFAWVILGSEVSHRHSLSLQQRVRSRRGWRTEF
ncbi:hypothetical protein RhiirA4_430201 [Rhizophagus irregularis]|uniref:Uncharacterized protein n=1 Tax=Rhizophagus irregularis TaxID=588596 RepID=A0A2I1HJU4_9GLOM|nr:hypothetical protein RhiirA4_430201 [Rhizophagus irregularis]